VAKEKVMEEHGNAQTLGITALLPVVSWFRRFGCDKRALLGNKPEKQMSSRYF